MAIRVLNACLYFCNYTIINFNLFTDQKISWSIDNKLCFCLDIDKKSLSKYGIEITDYNITASDNEGYGSNFDIEESLGNKTMHEGSDADAYQYIEKHIAHNLPCISNDDR